MNIYRLHGRRRRDRTGRWDQLRRWYEASLRRRTIDPLFAPEHAHDAKLAEIKFHIRVPMDDHRQIVRHRTASINEYSTRYSDVIKRSRKTMPSQWRLQDQNNKQGSQIGDIEWPEGYEVQKADDGTHGTLLCKGKPVMVIDNVETFTPAEFLTRRQAVVHMRCGEFYDTLREFGIAREQSRQNIVISTYTEYYWKIGVHNLLHFLKLRMDTHAQWEVRQYANAMASIVMNWLPLTWAAFHDYVLHAITFTLRDQTVMRHLLCGRVDLALECAKSYGWGKSSRERKEFVK